MSFVRDLRIAFHSLMRTQGLSLTVILTLALGIGANAAIFTLVRGVLLKPLVNRDEDRLIYIRQSATGNDDDNTTFSVPEIQDLRASVKTLSALGEFSTLEFTMIGLGEPRVVQSGVVSGNFFEHGRHFRFRRFFNGEWVFLNAWDDCTAWAWVNVAPGAWAWRPINVCIG